MPDNKQPWDKTAKENATALATISTPAYTGTVSTKPAKQIETIAGTEKVKYGLGKPVRISIIGDIKHDSDQ